MPARGTHYRARLLPVANAYFQYCANEALRRNLNITYHEVPCIFKSKEREKGIKFTQGRLSKKGREKTDSA